MTTPTLRSPLKGCIHHYSHHGSHGGLGFQCMTLGCITASLSRGVLSSGPSSVTDAQLLGRTPGGPFAHLSSSNVLPSLLWSPLVSILFSLTVRKHQVFLAGASCFSWVDSAQL